MLPLKRVSSYLLCPNDLIQITNPLHGSYLCIYTVHAIRVCPIYGVRLVLKQVTLRYSNPVHVENCHLIKGAYYETIKKSLLDRTINQY